MLADPADQQRLLTVADLDSDLSRLQHSARSLPQHQRVAELMAERERITDGLTSASTQVDDLQVDVRRAENDLVPVKARLERETKRVEDGSVTDQKTLRGLLEEIERIRKRIDTLEDEQLEVMGELESAEEVKAALAAKKTELEDVLREVVAERNEEVGKLQSRAKAVQTSRAENVAKLPADLLKLYERVKEKRGVGAARLTRGRCGACQLQVTVVDLDAFRRAPANEVLRCTECDSILVRTPESGL